MRSYFQAELLIAGFLAFGPVGGAQRPKAPPLGGGMKLVLEPIDSAGVLPERFNIVLENNSGHDMYLPRPNTKCHDAAIGDALLEAYFVPADPSAHPSVSTCVCDSIFRPILERAKSWMVLKAGESLRLEVGIRGVVDQAPAEGRYTISAHFSPAALSREEMETLHQNGMDVPTVDLETPTLHYEVKRSH